MYQGNPDAAVSRFTPARGGEVSWERRRPRRHTAQPRPRRIGILGAPTSSSAHDSAPPAGDRSSTRPYVDSPPLAEDRYPGSADVLVGTLDTRPAWPRVDPVGHVAALQKSWCTATTPTQTRSGVGADPCVCPSGSSLWLGLRRADTGVCPYALRSIDKPGKLREGGQPDSPRVASGRCSCKPHPKIQPEKLHPQIGYRRFTPASGGQVPPARRPRPLSSIHPRSRRIGILGAPTSSSAHWTRAPRG